MNFVVGGHTNTERGYLPTLADRLKQELAREAETDVTNATVLKALKVDISKADKHPLQIV